MLHFYSGLKTMTNIYNQEQNMLINIQNFTYQTEGGHFTFNKIIIFQKNMFHKNIESKPKSAKC